MTSAESLLRDERRMLRARIERALADDDAASFEEAMRALHWYGHDDPDDHAFVHRVELGEARRRGDRRGTASAFLPFLFGGLVARVERLGFVAIEEAFVAAPKELVYDVVADVARYAAWNPWLVQAEGSAEVGGSVVADVRLGTRTTRADHRVLVAERGARFAWCDVGWFTPLARGRRFRSFVASGEGTRVITRLVVVGPLASLVDALYGAAMRDGMTKEMSALKARAEQLASAPHAGAATSAG